VRLSIQATKLFPSNGLYYAQLAEFEGYPPADQTVQLTWTAPGDSGYVGTAASYETRWGTTEITDEATWNGATIASSPPSPQTGGTSQSMTVGLGTLPAGARVWFAVRAKDEGGSQGTVPGSVWMDVPAAGQ